MARSYEQFCPVARTLDLVGERWSLLIVRQLLIEPHRWVDLQAALPGISPTLLRDRLRALGDAGLVRQVELPAPASRVVYELTGRGAALEPVVYEIARWGLPLLDAPTDAEPLRPGLVGSGIKALARTEAVPDEPLCVALVLAEGDYTLEIAEAVDHEGRPIRAVDRVVVTDGAPDQPDVTIKSQLVVLLWLRRGDLDLPTAVDDDLISVAGKRAAVRAVQQLLGLEGSVEYERQNEARTA